MSIVSKLNNIYKPLQIGSPAFIGGIESTEGQTSIVSVLNFTGVATGTYTITTNVPLGSTTILTNKAQTYVSDGTNWYLFSY